MTQLLHNAAAGTALILAVAVLRQTLKNRLLPEVRLALWAVCLFRLLTPFAPESILSLWGLFRRAPEAAPAQGAPIRSSLPVQISPAGAHVPAAAPGTAPVLSPGTVLAALWLAVGLALAARYVLLWRRTRRAVGHTIPVEEGDPRYVPLPRFARLREGAMDGAPLTFGAVRPTVVLSPGLEGAALDCVLAHEGVHARRRDNLWHYATALALAAFWWDPAVWLMARLLRRDVELSCDRAALRRLGPERRKDYALALVSMSTQAGGPAFCHTFGRKAAEERILSVMKFKKTSILSLALSLLLVFGITAAFASDPAGPRTGAEQDGTVEYHGRTYNRADLSQETLDWLDWYLSLSEEGQMSVSMVPPELIPQGDAAAYDANAQDDGASDPAQRSTRLLFDNGKLTQLIITMDALAEDLSVQVREGALTQAEADQILTQAAAIARDGVLDWVFDGTSGLALESTGENSEAVCYRDGNGNLVHVSLSDIVRLFILPAAALETPAAPDPDLPDNLPEGEMFYKDEDGKLNPIDPDTVSTAVSVTVNDDGTVTFDNGSGPVDLHLPESAYVWIDGKDGELPPFSSEDYIPLDPENVDLSKLEEYLARKVADGKMTQAEADEALANVQEMLEQAKDGDMTLWISVDGSGDADSFCVSSYSSVFDGVSDDVELPSST